MIDERCSCSNKKDANSRPWSIFQFRRSWGSPRWSRRRRARTRRLSNSSSPGESRSVNAIVVAKNAIGVVWEGFYIIHLSLFLTPTLLVTKETSTIMNSEVWDDLEVCESVSVCKSSRLRMLIAYSVLRRQAAPAHSWPYPYISLDQSHGIAHGPIS